MTLATLIGVAGYFFICAFNPAQLYSMLRGRNVNLGAWPLASLTLGLALLALSYTYTTVPDYVFSGTLTSFAFTALIFALVLKDGSNG